jgi:Tol biopolymer transport system component/predicted Ser/Thr protein kinase
VRLQAGAKLAAYEILAPLGAGGMGEVYRAHDPRLGRDVAIKVLPAARVADEDRRRRFVQEARAASALNHSNIVTIHEIESADGTDFIVMELVIGKTLAELIRPGMRLREAVRVAIHVADALARAHGAGIVHRDLKPANVMVAEDGKVKVLDFGLAKLPNGPPSRDGDSAPATVESQTLSHSGTVGGTPGYMSPEQASGGPIDARSDVFSFGALLYEMVTGRRAFAGSTAAETLAAVMRDQPRPASDLVAGTPKDLEKLIARCLRKEPDKRFQHMADVKVELEELLDESSPTAAPAAPTRWRPSLASVAALVVLVGLVATLQRARRSRQAPASRVVPLTATAGYEAWPTFSPDGSQIAFSWEGDGPNGADTPNWDIWLKIVGSSDARRLTTDSGFDSFPSWSADGREIAFLRLQPNVAIPTVHVVSALGGSERKVAEFPAARSQLGWSPDGRWLAVGRRRARGEDSSVAGGIHLISVREGETRALTAPQPPAFDVHPAFSPDGRRLAYASCAYPTFPPCDVFVLELDARLAPLGPPKRLTRQPAGILGLTWSRDGTSLIFGVAHVGTDKGSLWRVGVRDGRAPERIELAPEGALWPAASRSQDRLAFSLNRTDTDVYRFQADGPTRPVLASSFSDYNPVFSPDGRRLAFESGRSGQGQEIWLADPDGSNAVQFSRGPGLWQGTPAFSPDGARIAFNARGQDGFADLWIMDVGGGSLRRLTHGPFHEGMPSWSPDGRWIYFREDLSDGREIARIPANGGTPHRVTKGGGFLPMVSADGKTLFYVRQDGVSPILSMTLPEGLERTIVDCAVSRTVTYTAHGIYYVACSPPGGVWLTPALMLAREPRLYRFDPVRGHSELLGTLPLGAGQDRLAVSPLDKSVLFGMAVATNSDLMLIEDFR